ncbi:MAG: arsenite methyltransferase [Candidatus Latescibacteria bacterium]|nr:arsenite methyltransferase [Candidatus Latescibacterota bacterium]
MADPGCEPTCCTDTGTPVATTEQTRSTVRRGYASIARGEASSCCGNTASDATDLARGVGYDSDELASRPEGANLGLSCGNPTALAALTGGEVVLDLGSGAGFDVFIAADRVGPEGRVIGVDMTAEMIDRARQNAASYTERTGIDNVEFRLGEIEHLPVADASVDVVISNCVINLSPDKTAVWREIARVLKPGGRVSVSDIALKRALPDQVREAVQALVGCVAGAVMVADTEAMARAAGLADITLEQRDGNIAAMESWHDPLYREIEAGLPSGTTPSDFVTSLAVSARKSGQA